MACLDSCANVSMGICGKFVASQKGFKSEAIPKTEISAVKIRTGVELKPPCRWLLASLYLLSLNSLDFNKFVSWQTVSSRTEMLDLSYSTISGLIVCLKTKSVWRNVENGRSTANHCSGDLFESIHRAILSRILLCRLWIAFQQRLTIGE